MSWTEYYKKAGGLKLLKQYWKCGTLLTAVIQFLMLGRSKKALEILRLSTEYKTNNLLERKYGKCVGCVADSTKERIPSQRIWIYWHQGIENAPEIVKVCYKSVTRYFNNWTITVITADNMHDYVSFPENITHKVDEGKITLTHLSDLLRLELLIKYGGLWLDATVFCTGGTIPRSILTSDLFCFQCLKPGADGHATLMSSWLLYAKTNNHLLIETLKLCYKYWETHDEMLDYFLLHHFFTIVCSHCKEEAARIPQYCNSTPHILLLNMFNEFDQQFYDDLCAQTTFHKLSYKFTDEQVKVKGTYYDHIVKHHC